MARIIGIDYGTKRTGIATTDPLQIIASPLETVETPKVFAFLTNYFFTEEVERIIVGEPKKLDDSEAEIMPKIRVLVVDDAVVMRRMITEALGSDPDLEVVGVAANVAAVMPAALAFGLCTGLGVDSGLAFNQGGG